MSSRELARAWAENLLSHRNAPFLPAPPGPIRVRPIGGGCLCNSPGQLCLLPPRSPPAAVRVRRVIRHDAAAGDRRRIHRRNRRRRYCQDRRAISPYVYGYNAGSTAGAPPGVTWLRIGGNRWSAYNWTNNYSNAGSDWGPYSNDTFMGSPADGPGHAAVPPIDDAKAHGIGLLVTIPIQGWVSKDANGLVDLASPLTTRFALN